MHKILKNLFIFICCILALNCKKEDTSSPVNGGRTPTTSTYSVTISNDLVNYHKGDITVKFNGNSLPVIATGASRTVTGVAEGVYAISANGVGFVGINGSVPVYGNIHVGIEGDRTFGQVPQWVAYP